MKRVALSLVMLVLLVVGTLVSDPVIEAQDDDTPAATPAADPREIGFARFVEGQLDIEDEALAAWDQILADYTSVDDRDWWLNAAVTAPTYMIVFGAWRESPPPPARYQAFYDAYSAAAEAVLGVFADYSSALLVQDQAAFEALRPAYDQAVPTLLDQRRLVPPPPAGIGVASATGAHTIVGSVLLSDVDASWRRGGFCSGESGFENLRGGADVIVRDESATIIAVGRLESGEALSQTRCWFAFIIEDVPPAEFYTFTVAGRGAPTYSYDDLDAASWVIAWELGR